MRIIGNIIWFIFGGIILGVSWIIAGIFWCITIIGIPFGIQCFKLAKLAFFPFGKEIVYDGKGAGSFVGNLFWLLLSGWILALEAAIIGILFCITIIGIPFGKQCFKMAKLALLPFGAQVVKSVNKTPQQKM